jgi:predicted RND superfamily exporter protein
MLPNVFPPLIVFGAMGWWNVTVDFGSMMTISTALGISVDNELHFFAWFRSFLRQGLSRSEALLRTYRCCGDAMEHTAIICGLGVLMYVFSPFVPVARFGWIMFLLILIAMAGDMVLLPALLASPIGRVFGASKKRSAPAPAAAPFPVAAIAAAGCEAEASHSV